MQPSIAASAAHDRLIAVLAQLHSLRYCPQVPALALILLGALSEPEAFGAMQALLRAQRDVSRPRDAVAAERAKVEAHRRDLAALDESIEGARAAMAKFRGEF